VRGKSGISPTVLRVRHLA